MALIQCTECGKEISNKASSCPNCGVPLTQEAPNFFDESEAEKRIAKGKRKVAEKKEQQKGAVVQNLIVLAIVAGGFYWFWKWDSAPEAPKSVAEKRTEEVEECFSSWDGSHRNLETLIKTTMNAPDSYEHVETRYSDYGESLTVSTTFRGKNAFGGTVKNSIIARTDLDCNVIEVLSQGS